MAAMKLLLLVLQYLVLNAAIY